LFNKRILILIVNEKKDSNGLNKRIERDKIKRELCKKNNLPLYYINYNDNIKEKLNEILKNYG